MNTSYVSLEHPYQIIEYQGVLGIQIGTLIVTVDKSDDYGDYAIETHSHPVVSYVNNKIHTDTKIHRSLSLPRPYEGVVWNKVELHDVRTLVREGERLSWADFMDYCRRLRFGELEGTLKNIDAAIMDNYGVLLDWGIDIGYPKGGNARNDEFIVEVDNIAKYDDKEYLITEGDMGIVVRYSEENELMFSMLFQQVDFFLTFMKYFDIATGKVKFWTQNLFLQELTDKLNERWAFHVENKLYDHDGEEEYEGVWMAAEDLTEPEHDD